MDRIESLRRILKEDPGLNDAHGQLGALLLERARALQTSAMSRRENRAAEAAPVYRESLAHFRAAARLRPDRSLPHRRCGVVLTELGELEAALAAFAAAYRLDPDVPGVAAEYAGALQAAGDPSAAIAVYERSLRRHPGDAALHGGLALTLLGCGDFERGWEEYEWRLKLPDAGMKRSFPFPRWQGEPLGASTLLVSSEQGIGDEIMFASCFDELIAAARHCVLEVSTRLEPLFRRSFPSAMILTRNLERMPDWSELPEIDFCIPAGSVPRFLRRAAGAFPQREFYLRPDAKRAEHWREHLSRLGSAPKIGLAWTGGLPGTLRAARSLELRDLRPLLAAGHGIFVALEFLDCTDEVDAFNRAGAERVAWWPEALGTLDETAAVVSALDLVVTVTTATAHLSGALGRPTWTLVPRVPSWRYLWEGERTPWYPGMRIFRGARGQPRDALVAGVRTAFEEWRRGALSASPAAAAPPG